MWMCAPPDFLYIWFVTVMALPFLYTCNCNLSIFCYCLLWSLRGLKYPYMVKRLACMVISGAVGADCLDILQPARLHQGMIFEVAFLNGWVLFSLENGVQFFLSFMQISLASVTVIIFEQIHMAFTFSCSMMLYMVVCLHGQLEYHRWRRSLNCWIPLLGRQGFRKNSPLVSFISYFSTIGHPVFLEFFSLNLVILTKSGLPTYIRESIFIVHFLWQ
jgi:hypothetical protein